MHSQCQTGAHDYARSITVYIKALNTLFEIHVEHVNQVLSIHMLEKLTLYRATKIFCYDSIDSNRRGPNK